MAAGLQSYEFRREREAQWSELENLIVRFEKQGVRSLSAGELERMPILYRHVLSSLSVARAISLDQNLVQYLEALSTRGYFCVYGTRTTLISAIKDFISRQFPAGVRRARWHVLLSTVMMLAGTATAFILTSNNADLYYSFVSDDYASGRTPASSTEKLRGMLYDNDSGVDDLVHFAAFLFTHNAQIGMLAFATGFLLGIPVFLLMFTNGLILGAFAALFHSRGLSLDLWGWLLPHGITELTAVILCGAGGLILGQAVVFPGRRTRLRNLAFHGREAVVLLVGAVMMLFIAGGIEGVFRQTVTDIVVRYLVAATTAVFWLLYFVKAGREAEDESLTR